MSPCADTLYVIDDDASVRASLGRLLRLEGFRVQTFPSADEFLKESRYERPACVISDVRMPGLSGLELQDFFEQQGIPIPIIFITGHGEIAMSVQAMKKGAVDFLPKPYTKAALFEAVSQAMAKEHVSLSHENSVQRVQRRHETLTGREKQVLGGVVSGMLNKQIAFKMGITEKTVKVHRAAVMQKMKAASVAHLVRLAEVVGITLAAK